MEGIDVEVAALEAEMAAALADLGEDETPQLATSTTPHYFNEEFLTFNPFTIKNPTSKRCYFIVAF